MLPLHLLPLIPLIAPSLAVKCHPPRSGILPLTPHCNELIHRLISTGRTPRGLAPKEWSRTLENSATTVHLPKIYWIAGAGPRTCGVIVDADPHTPDVIQKFNLGDVGHAAEQVEFACLFRKGEVGTQRVGLERRVEVSLDRVDVDAVPIAGMAVVDVERAGYDGYLLSAELGNLTDVRAS
ncbi:MAG: hypothetical protein Q9169_006265 [Polycauliona sp. 2 TL-2023]